MILYLVTGCSGYRFTQQENPLSQYGIQSLSIPMFYNYSNLSGVSGEFTRETYRLLTSYSGLKLISGYSEDSDAVLIGIIKTQERLKDSLRPGSMRVAKGQAPVSVGSDRQNFYIPGSTSINVVLQVIVIKKPTEEEIALLKSGIGDQIEQTSRVIFNVALPLTSQFTREVLDGEGTDVIATQNSGIQRRTVRTLAEQAALSIRDMILYAF